MNGIIRYVAFSIWLSSLNTLFQGLYMTEYLSVLHSFLRPNNILLFGCNTFCLLFHWWTLSCFHLLAICLCLGVKLLDHMFNIWVTDKLFYRDTDSTFFHSHQPWKRVPIALHCCQDCLLSLFNFNHVSRCEMVSRFDLYFSSD